MARASGLTLAGGPAKNDALNATTQGVGELIDTALNAGAKKIIVCLGGSATTDGGLGAIKAISTPARLLAVEFLVACDVDTLFTDAAKVFAPQKGATPAQVGMLTGRLEQLAQRYERDYGINIARMPGSGAAGGLAGGLAALGAKLIPGFDIVAEENGFDEAVKEHDIVITGEGLLDDTSFDGKVVGSVLDYAQDAKTRTIAIVGDIDEAMDSSLRAAIEVISITEKFGTETALHQVLRCVEDTTTQVLTKLLS
jgi:glycerate kinase